MNGTLLIKENVAALVFGVQRGGIIGESVASRFF